MAGLNFTLLLAVICATFAVVSATISDVNQLSFDENDRLLNNYLLFTEGPNCNIAADELDYRPSEAISAELGDRFFGANPASYGNCAAVCLQKGTHRDHVFHPLPNYVGTNLSSVEYFGQRTCQPTEVGFLSHYDNVCNIYWVNHRNQRVKVGTLKKGERNTIWQQSQLGHRFIVEDSVTLAVLLDVTLTNDAVYPIGQLKSAVTPRNVDHAVEETFKMEWNRANRVTRTFTGLGFAKGRLPTELWSSISSYYYNNREHKIIEEWDSKGLYVNWWERDVYFIPMPWELKKVWQASIKLLVEAWSGVELETTDIYGMRRYEDGARLLTHVDRESTHAASIIMNIAQHGIRSPWKVEIYDFAGRLHEVEMDPGDIVYYESARCLHGRMRPLDGAYYVNLFAHYRPNGDPNWFSKRNPADAPEQVLEVGTCTSDGVHATCTGAEMPYLSPSLDKLTGPNDLYRFWKDTAPKPAAAAAVRGRDEL